MYHRPPPKRNNKATLAGVAYVGRLLLEIDRRKETDFLRSRWLDEAKDAAGYRRGVSFDVVWAEALAALKRQQADALERAAMEAGQ